MHYLKEAGIQTLLFAACAGTGLLGLQLATLQPDTTILWPPAGIAAAALLLIGYRVWPAIFAGVFAAHVLTAGTPVTALAIAVGDTTEALVIASFVNLFAGGRAVFGSTVRVVRFTIITLLVCTFSATLGVVALTASGLVTLPEYSFAWATWWLADSTSVFVLTPVILLWATTPRSDWTRVRAFEALLLSSTLCFFALVAFGRLLPFANRHDPLEFLCPPFLVWTAYRFSQRQVSSAMLGLSAIAMWGTLLGYGPFATVAHQQSFILLQAFLATTAIMSLVMSTVVAEHRATAAQLTELAVSDPLTGLANYRRLLEVLSGEIARSRRTSRPFAVLLFDVNALKQINDRYGHLAGSEALCRVGEALRRSCRSIDTVARFGGDEFTVILPETGCEGAQLVSHRVSERLASDPGPPVVAVSVGWAVFPDDGETSDDLLAAADAALYRMKGDVYQR